MNARKILIAVLPLLLLGFGIGGASSIQENDSSSADGIELCSPVSTMGNDSLLAEPDRPMGLRATLRHRLHVMRVLFDVMLGILESSLDSSSASTDFDAGA